MPGEDLNMSITINASITSEDEIILSLGHSSKGVYQNLTKYLAYEISEDDDEETSRYWKIDMTLPYPHSQASGDLTLSVGDSHSGDITFTRLILTNGEKADAPFFDPAPKSVIINLGQDVLINTAVKGSAPIDVSI